MLCIIDKSTDPCFNLAAEEYLLKEFSQPIFRLWRNSDSIIVGRYQNALAEIDIPYVEKHKIKVVRRLTGGGAVYHDLGNLNYTFIEGQVKGEDSAAMFKRFTTPVKEALQNLGIAARLDGRNDLVIEGRKFSGNAVCLHKDRLLQHGTLLFSSSAEKISAALKEKGEKFRSRAVNSNRREVTNIRDHLREKMGIEEFIAYLAEYICNRSSYSGDIVPYSYTAADMEAINQLCREKYSTAEWNFGKSPSYRFSNKRRYDCGTLEVCFDVRSGRIAGLSIFGDYFFAKPTEEFCSFLEGTPHEIEAIRKKIGSVDLNGYFYNISPDELTELFF